jgi:hypothetical protein
MELLGLVIDDSGNVGIGTTAPTQKLDVTGGILVNGTVGANTNYMIDSALNSSYMDSLISLEGQHRESNGSGGLWLKMIGPWDGGSTQDVRLRAYSGGEAPNKCVRWIC